MTLPRGHILYLSFDGHVSTSFYQLLLARIAVESFHWQHFYLIHYLSSITRSYKTNLHRASMKGDTLNTPLKKLML